MTEFTDWVNLGTMAGATTAVLLIVQYIKAPLDRVWKVPTRALAYFLSLFILLAAQAATEGLTWAGAGLALINAMLVALAAMGAYEATFAAGDTDQYLAAAALYADEPPVDEEAGEDEESV